MTLTVSMAYFNCREVVGKAVSSVLGQTYQDLRLVVVNDGDEPPQLPDDPRLTLLNLETNRGPYYCDAVVLAACDTEWFSIHASDDWSDSPRFQTLMDASDGYDVVWGGSIHHKWNTKAPRRVDFRMASRENVLLHRGSIATGIFRTEAIRRIGGPHPEFRVAYDTMMVHLLCRAHRWTHIRGEYGYHRVWREGSLTQAPETGMHSPLRNENWVRRDALWRDVIARPMEEWPALLAPSPEMAAQVAHDAKRLRALLHDRDRRAGVV